jgi:hypothetical protein
MKVIILIPALLVFLPGCDLFSTRDGEVPTSPRTNLPPAFTIDILEENLGNSYADKLVVDYLNCFSDSVFTGKSFTFIASSEAASQYPSLNDWDLKSEEDFFRNLINEDIPITLILSNSTFSQQGDSIFYTASYSLSVPFNDPGIPQNYQGDLIFYILFDNSNVLRIYFWQDFKSSNTPSWSELKGRFSN